MTEPRGNDNKVGDELLGDEKVLFLSHPVLFVDVSETPQCFLCI